MKRRKLEKHLRANQCRLDHEGGSHTVWKNEVSGEWTVVPRHPEIAHPTVEKVCKQLRIPKPKGKS